MCAVPKRQPSCTHAHAQRKHIVVKLRLMRMGKKKQPTYRVVAADARSPRDGRFIEILGTYDPRHEPSVVRLDTGRAREWIRNGNAVCTLNNDDYPPGALATRTAAMKAAGIDPATAAHQLCTQPWVATIYQ